MCKDSVSLRQIICNVILIVLFVGTVSAQDLSDEQVAWVKEIQEATALLNEELIPEQNRLHGKLRDAYARWADVVKRDRTTFDLWDSVPADVEQPRKEVAKLRAQWWGLSRKVHEAEERLNRALKSLFGKGDQQQ